MMLLKLAILQTPALALPLLNKIGRSAQLIFSHAFLIVNKLMAEPGVKFAKMDTCKMAQEDALLILQTDAKICNPMVPAQPASLM